MKGIKQIKNYRLTRQIGKGATGIVYEAIDEKSNTLVAIKAIPSSKLNEKRVMDNFKRELKLLHGLNHTNIIKIEGVEKTVNNLYLILEYCNGGNLYDYLYYYKKMSKVPLPEKYVQKVLRQLVDGLEYMHNCRTVHRDIKLENILLNFNLVSNKVMPGENPQTVDYGKVSLDDDLSIKIADLGYARELEGACVASTICGTPITMAPDIINLFDESKLKDQKYNNKVDLWSLGAITYELLIGRPPFYASSYKQLFEEIMNGQYTLPKNLMLSVEAITFINGLLQFFPDKRMNWNEIRHHPFLSKDLSTFHVLDLHAVDSDYKNPEELQLNTKDCDNFVWILFKNYNHNLPLDKVNAEIYNDPLIEKLKADISAKMKNQQSNKDDSDEEYEDTNEIRLADIDSDNKPAAVKKETAPNMVFGKIFTEIKQELKNSKQKDEIEEAKKREAEIEKKRQKEEQRLKEEAEIKRQLIEAEERRRLQEEAEEKRRLQEEERRVAEEKRRLQEEAERRAAEERRCFLEEQERRRLQEEAEKKAAEEKRRLQEEEERRAAEERIRKQEAEKKAAEERLRLQEEAARKEAEEKRRIQEEEERRAAEEWLRLQEEKRAAEEAERRLLEEEERRAAEERRRLEEEEERRAAEERRRLLEEEERRAAEEAERRFQEEASRKTAEERRRLKEEAERRAAEEKRRLQEEEERRAAEEKRRLQEEEERRAAEEKRRLQEEEERKRLQEEAERREAEERNRKRLQEEAEKIKVKEEEERLEAEKQRRIQEEEAKIKLEEMKRQQEEEEQRRLKEDLIVTPQIEIYENLEGEKITIDMAFSQKSIEKIQEKKDNGRKIIF